MAPAWVWPEEFRSSVSGYKLAPVQREGKRLLGIRVDRFQRSEKENALSAYDKLDRQELKKRYGLGMTEDGIRTRGEILGALTQSATYANVHSQRFPSGEIRGQIGDDGQKEHDGHQGHESDD